MKKSVVLVLCMVLCLSLVAFAGCGETAPEEVAVPDFTVEAVATEGDVTGTAADLLATVMDAEGMGYAVSEGSFVTIGEFANTETAGWLFYVDDVLCETAPADTAVAAGSKYALVWGDLVAEEAPAEGEEEAVEGEEVAEGEDVAADDAEAPAEEAATEGEEASAEATPAE